MTLYATHASILSGLNVCFVYLGPLHIFSSHYKCSAKRGFNENGSLFNSI